MDWSFLGVFTLATGIFFLILEIRQNSWMWLFQLLSAAAAMASFFREGLYASASLNLYYVVMAFVGIVQWRRDALRMNGNAASGVGGVSAAEDGNAGGIHLRRPSKAVLLGSLGVFVFGTAALFFLLRHFEDPKSVGDAAATVLSAVATWWLAKSYPQQWLLWIVADALSVWICLEQGMVEMGILYIIYTVSAVYGYYHWKKSGTYI